MATDCTVWRMFQARCVSCGWLGEIYGEPDRRSASYDARVHRDSPEHRAKLREQRDGRRRRPGVMSREGT